MATVVMHNRRNPFRLDFGRPTQIWRSIRLILESESEDNGARFRTKNSIWLQPGWSKLDSKALSCWLGVRTSGWANLAQAGETNQLSWVGKDIFAKVGELAWQRKGLYPYQTAFLLARWGKRLAWKPSTLIFLDKFISFSPTRINFRVWRHVVLMNFTNMRVVVTGSCGFQ